MSRTVQFDNSSLHQASGPGWDIFGELQLTVGIDTELTVNKWLAVILGRLHLREEFRDQVLKSAREAASRAMQAEGVRKFEHLHLLIFVPSDRTQNSSNWGFYSIEKVEQASGNANPDHAIEFYLYQDGK